MQSFLSALHFNKPATGVIPKLKLYGPKINPGQFVLSIQKLNILRPSNFHQFVILITIIPNSTSLFNTNKLVVLSKTVYHSSKASNLLHSTSSRLRNNHLGNRLRNFHNRLWNRSLLYFLFRNRRARRQNTYQ